MDARFILISHYRSPVTGAHQRFDRLARRLARDGRPVLWLSPPRPEFRRWSNVEFLDTGNMAGRGPVQLRLARAVLRHRARLRDQRGRGVVLSFGETNLPAAWLASRLSGAPMSLGVRSDAVQCLRLEQAAARGWRGALNRILFIPRTTIWGCIYRQARQVVVQTPAAASAAVTNFGLRPDVVHTVGNDLPVERVASHAVDKRGLSGPTSCLFVGSDSPIKGFDVLLAAIDRLPRWAPGVRRFTTVGVSSGAFERLARRAADTGIRLQRYESTPDLMRLMAAHDLLLVPSRQDQFPNLVLEALGLGVPVIGSRIDGIAHVLGDSSLLFEPGDADDLLRCLGRVADRAGYAHALKLTRERAQRFRFDWEEHYLQAVEQAMRACSPNRRPAPPP